MKALRFIAPFCAAIVALAACSKVEEQSVQESIQGEGVPFSVMVSSTAGTRTANDGLNTKWVSTDKVSVFHAPAGGNYVLDGEFSIKDTETGLFDGTVTASPVEGNLYDWVAVYPYSSHLETVANTENCFFAIGSKSQDGFVQTQAETGSMAHLAGEYFPMVGKSAGVEYTGEAPFIQMNQIAAVAAFKVTNSTSADINVSNIEFTAPELIVGTFYIDFSQNTPVLRSSGSKYTADKAVLNVTDGTIKKGETGIFYLGIRPFTVSSGQNLSLKVTTSANDSQTKTFNISSDVTFHPGKIKTLKMDFTTEHIDLGTEFIQISSLSDITADGQYVFVMPDVVNKRYYVLNNNGKSSNLSLVTSIVENAEGLLVFDAPDNKFIWSVANTSGNAFNFRNTTASGYSCIYNPNKDTEINTAYKGSQSWTPELLDSGCFKLYNSNEDPRFLAYGTTQTEAKAYKTSGTFYDQVALGVAPKQYSGAWAILKLGGSSSSQEPSIEPVVISDLPARSSENAVEVTTKNTQSALVIKAVDGTVVSSATVMGNTVIYTVSNNYGSEARNGSITVALADDETVTATVSVAQKAPVWNVSRNTVDIKAAAGSTATITVNSDFDWTIDASGITGVTLDPASFTYEGDSKQVVTITTTVANMTAESVSLGSFKIVREDNAELDPVVINQTSAVLAAPELTLTPDSANKKFSVSWYKNSNATKYEYYVLDEDEQVVVPNTLTDDNTTLTFEVADITYGMEYTAYVRAIGDGNPWMTSEWATSKTIVTQPTALHDLIDLTAQGYANEAVVTTVNGTYSTIVFAKGDGSNAPKYYTNGTSVRTYAKNTLTVSVSSGKKLTKIIFTLGGTKSAAVTASNGTLGSISGSSRTWTASEGSSTTSVVFTNGGSNQMHYQKIDIYYE